MTSINVEGTPSHIASFLHRFYAVSDDVSAHQDYIASFDHASSDFFFQIGPMSPVTSASDTPSQGLLDYRTKAWEPISHRKHTVYQVYPSSDSSKNGSTYMLHGKVDYTKKDGSEAGATWAGRIVFSPDSSEVKMQQYQVWIVGVQGRISRAGDVT